RAVELCPAGQLARSIDRKLAVRLPPAANRVKILQAKAELIHDLVARGADGALAVDFELLSQRGVGLRFLRRFQVRRIGGRIGGRRAEDVFEHPLASLHGRGAAGIARERQDAGLRKNSRAAIVGEGNSLELVAADALDSVMLRQPSVNEREIGAEK